MRRDTGCYVRLRWLIGVFFFFQAEDGIRDVAVTGVQTCALPITFPRRGDGNDRRGGRRRSRGDTRGELFRRPIPQRAVRAYGVVIHPPGFDHLPCVSEIHEPVLVQTLIAELPVEALDERVLRGLAA